MQHIRKSITFFGSCLFALCLLLPQTAMAETRPSVMFMIAEQNIGQEIFVFWWGWFSSGTEFKAQEVDLSVAETTLKEAFLNDGFDVIDVSNVSDKIKVSNAYKIADLTKDAAIELGKDVGADVVIKGKVIAKAGPKISGSSVGSYIADMTVTAFQVKDGLVLGAGRGHSTARHISEISGGTQAIERASQKVAEKLIEQINSKMGQ
ncbi:hypothetical protein JYT87_01130 [Nitrospira defluvii]|nr:hypothetical protein [Nitrospira defluvii]